MAYVWPNYPTKKQLKEAVAAGEMVTVFQPGPFGTGNEREGRFCVEGPHFPAPHTWYAAVTVKDGKVIKVNS